MIFTLACSDSVDILFSLQDATNICLMDVQEEQCASRDEIENKKNSTDHEILWRFSNASMGRQKWSFMIGDCQGTMVVDVEKSWKNQIQHLKAQCSTKIQEYRMNSISSGVYSIGDDAQSSYREDDEILHEVQIQHPFLIGTTEVTQKLYQNVMGSNPASFDANECSRVGNLAKENPNEPVYCVSWYEALEFANTLSIQEGYTPCYTILTKNAVWAATCNGYRLPTESEWEIAASQSSLSQAWIKENAEGKTHEVAQKSPNPQGLYDMLGNVWEWTWDGYGAYPTGLSIDPKGHDDAAYRVMRGGTWAKGVDKSRVSDRANFHPAFRMDVTGLRLARTLYPPTKQNVDDRTTSD